MPATSLLRGHCALRSRLRSTLPPQRDPEPDGPPEKKQEPSEKFTLYNARDIIDAPPPEWHIDGHIVEGSFVVLYGPPDSYKSFVSIDHACCSATGTPWLGHFVKKGPAIYVAAEGFGGLGARLNAWRLENKIEDPNYLPDVYWINKAVNLLKSDDVHGLITSIKRVGASLVVFDTLARCLVGGDENSSQDMGAAIERIDIIKGATNATVMAVHHTGKNEQTERGSSALRGAADTMIKLKRAPDGPDLGLYCDKQKDSERFKSKYLYVKPVRNSIVLTDSPDMSNPDMAARTLDDKMKTVLVTIHALPIEQSPTFTVIEKASKLSPSTFLRKINSLVEYGFVARAEDNTYALTVLGTSVVTSTTL